MGYFFWLNESIGTINATNEIANISVSNTDTGTTPFHSGSEPTTFESPIYYPLIIAHIRSHITINLICFRIK